MPVIPGTPNIKATFFFQSTDAVVPVGWSETHYLGNAVTELNVALAFAQQLAPLRANLLGGGYMITYLRVSKETIFRDSRIDDQGWGPVMQLGKLATQAVPEGDFAYSIFLIRAESGNNVRKSIYVGGIQDGLQVLNQKINDAKFTQAYTNWTSALKASWGFMGLARDANNKPVNPKSRVFYAYTNFVQRRYGFRKRGRPFELLRGRSRK